MNKQRVAAITIATLVVTLAAGFAFGFKKDPPWFRYVSRRLGLIDDQNTAEVLRTMKVSASRKHYDYAITTGQKWTTRHPMDGSNDQVFLAISVIFLERAKRDRTRADE